MIAKRDVIVTYVFSHQPGRVPRARTGPECRIAESRPADVIADVIKTVTVLAAPTHPASSKGDSQVTLTRSISAHERESRQLKAHNIENMLLNITTETATIIIIQNRRQNWPT